MCCDDSKEKNLSLQRELAFSLKVEVMGMTTWVMIRDGAERYSNEEDHSAMLALREELDSVAKILSVQKLSDFYDYTELNFSYRPIDELEESLEETWNNDDAQWFSPQAGMATLRAILNFLAQTPQGLDLSQTHWTIDCLVDELQDCNTELMQAVEQGYLFHLCIVE